MKTKHIHIHVGRNKTADVGQGKQPIRAAAEKCLETAEKLVGRLKDGLKKSKWAFSSKLGKCSWVWEAFKQQFGLVK